MSAEEWSANAMIEDVQSFLNKLMADINELISDFEDAEAEIRKLEETITSKNMRIQELKSQLSAV
jgi:cell division septum initiation protein DivIVA